MWSSMAYRVKINILHVHNVFVYMMTRKLTHRIVSTVLPHIVWNTPFRICDVFNTEFIKWTPSTLYMVAVWFQIYGVFIFLAFVDMAPCKYDWRLPLPNHSPEFHSIPFCSIIHEMYAHTHTNQMLFTSAWFPTFSLSFLAAVIIQSLSVQITFSNPFGNCAASLCVFFCWSSFFSQ